MSPAASLAPDTRALPWRGWLLALLAVSVWINASEVARYVLFVMPMTRESLAMVPGVAPMNLPVFLVWGLWDTLLVGLTVAVYWLVAERFGTGWGPVLAAGTIGWLFLFVLFWVAMLNMNLTRPLIPAIALPWAWGELVVASAIARRCLRPR